jgi:Periplasmic glycine betaine/choline-binding (lipo)protein of an ABC-type transport system (osmoprotectant binding protein)
MNLTEFFTYVSQNWGQIASLTLEHIRLTAVSVGIAILIGVPLGILVCYAKKLSKPVLGVASVVQAIPSMALLGFAIPFLGIGTLPAVSCVILYSLLPIIKNTVTGIESINPQTVEAAQGIGLTRFQILTKVQIPLALPVIMAGVRISAVTAVGLMTIAAFIGAGGLGFLVFSGIRTVNNNQILAGAIPACLLALLVDLLLGIVEKLVTPISLQKANPNAKRSIQKTRRLQKVILSAFCLFLVAVFGVNLFAGGSASAKTITVGGKDFSEQMIMTNMVADLIEDRTDISVIRKENLGGTQVCFSALKSGDIDLYVEYSGTAYGDTLKHPPISDTQKVYDTVKKELKEKFDIDALDQMSFNNTYTLAVTPETAQKYNLKTISDLAKVGSRLRVGTTLEFLNRADGLPGLTKKYGFQFQKSIGLDGSPRYVALTNGETDVVDAFSTDGLLKKFGLVTLKDDKNFFPPYYAMPIVRGEIAEKYPEIIPVLKELGPHLTDEVMMELNYEVDELQKQPADVAHSFLVKEGLIAS